MSSTARLVVDIIRSTELASQAGGHGTIHILCEDMRNFLTTELQRLNFEGALEITPENPQGDDIQYCIRGANVQNVADIAVAAVITAFSSGPSGKGFRYVVYSLADIDYQPRIKTFADISKTDEGKKHHIALERSLTSALKNPEIIAWLKGANHLSFSIDLRGEPWTGVHVDLYCRVSENQDIETHSTVGTGELLDSSEVTRADLALTPAPPAQTQDRGVRKRQDPGIDDKAASSGAHLLLEGPPHRDKTTFAKHVDLSEDDRISFQVILDAAGMNQKRLAELAQISPGWLSQMLKGQRKRLDSEKIERVANVLVESLTRRQTDGAFPEQRVRIALASLSRFSEVAAGALPPRTYPAGGPVPVDGAHYIHREADDEAMEALQREPFTMVVKGPVQCGKSSILARLEHRARQLGFETAWFDPRVPISPQPKPTQQATDPDSEAPLLLSELLQAEWGLEPVGDREPISIRRVVTWLGRAMSSTRSKPRLLILDDLSKLGPRGVEDWSQFVRTMHNKRATGGPQVSIAVGVTYNFVPYFERKLFELSSVVHWWPRIELGWFDSAAAGKLVNMVTGESSMTDSIYELFKGQPYLTHAGALDESFRSTIEHWTHDNSEGNAESVLSSQIYRRYLNALRLTVLGPTLEANGEALRLLDAFVGTLSGQTSLDRDQKLFLERAKVLTEAGTPTLSICRLIAHDLIKSVRRS